MTLTIFVLFCCVFCRNYVGVIKFRLCWMMIVFILTQSCIIRNLSKKQFKVLLDISLKLNELRNCAVEITSLIKSADGKHYEKLNFKHVIGKVKEEFKDYYSCIQVGIAGATIKKHVDSFNAYIVLKNMKVDGEFDRCLNEPKKHDDDCLHNIIIPRGFITSSKKKLAEGYIELPLSREYKRGLESNGCRLHIKIPENICDKDIIQVEIIPINNGRMFKANFTYSVKKEACDLDKN